VLKWNKKIFYEGNIILTFTQPCFLIGLKAPWRSYATVTLLLVIFFLSVWFEVVKTNGTTVLSW